MVDSWSVNEPQTEVPTERRKKELMQLQAESEHFLLLDDRLNGFMWEIKHMRSEPWRNRVIERFWNRVYSGYHIEDGDGLQIRSFVLNDFLRASDELYESNTPARGGWIHRHGCIRGIT
jgi:hypothetical protein